VLPTLDPSQRTGALRQRTAHRSGAGGSGEGTTRCTSLPASSSGALTHSAASPWPGRVRGPLRSGMGLPHPALPALDDAADRASSRLRPRAQPGTEDPPGSESRRHTAPLAIRDLVDERRRSSRGIVLHSRHSAAPSAPPARCVLAVASRRSARGCRARSVRRHRARAATIYVHRVEVARSSGERVLVGEVEALASEVSTHSIERQHPCLSRGAGVRRRYCAAPPGTGSSAAAHPRSLQRRSRRISGPGRLSLTKAGRISAQGAEHRSLLARALRRAAGAARAPSFTAELLRPYLVVETHRLASALRPWFGPFNTFSH